MVTAIELAIAAGDLITANQREHYQVRARKTAALRYRAQVTALVLRQHVAPLYERAHVTIWVSWPDRRRRDVLNLAPTVKACIDGMTDAGLWPDDDDLHLIGPDFRVSPELSRLKGVTVLRFEVVPA